MRRLVTNAIRCGVDSYLQVHHKKYIKGRMAWEYAPQDLIVLCRNCHTDEHSAREILQDLVSQSTFSRPTHLAAALFAGFTFAANQDEDLINIIAKVGALEFMSGVAAYAEHKGMSNLLGK